jgi:hypothetical protein
VKNKFVASALLNFGKSLLIASGLPEDRARDVAEILLEGDLLGHTTHGVALYPMPALEPLLKRYVSRYRHRFNGLFGGGVDSRQNVTEGWSR